jgi:hypothetical protein
MSTFGCRVLQGSLRRCLFRGLGDAGQAGANQEGRRTSTSIRSVNLRNYCTMSHQPSLGNKQSQGSAFTRSNGSFGISTSGDNWNTSTSVVPERRGWAGRCGEKIPSHPVGRAPMRGRRGRGGACGEAGAGILFRTRRGHWQPEVRNQPREWEAVF